MIPGKLLSDESISAVITARVAAALCAASRVMTALRHRRAIRSLAELDERALKDIGLVASDVHGALAEPFYRDPSTVLLLRSVERRAGIPSLAAVTPAVTPRRFAVEAERPLCA